MTWRVGVLFSQTGVTSGIERTQLNATLLAIEEINAAGGVLGRPIEPDIYDPASDPKKFRALAERLFQVDRVRLLFGCYMSSTRKAVLPVVEGVRGLLFYPTLYEGFEYSLHCIYTGAAPNQNSLQLAKFLLSAYGNRFLLIGSNYIYPYESNRVMADFVIQSKGKVLDEIYVPLDAQAKDFNKAISKIAALKPDVVFSTVVGQSTAVFYEAYRRAGFDANRMPIASLTTSEAEVAEMSPEAAEGHITAAPFFETLATAGGAAFRSAYKLRYGADAPVTAGAEAAYFQVHLAVRGAGARRHRRPGTAAAGHCAIPNSTRRKGACASIRSNNHTYLWPRVAELDARGHFQIVWNPGVRVKPDPYCVVMSLDDWSARPSAADPRLSGGRRGSPDPTGSSWSSRSSDSSARQRALQLVEHLRRIGCTVEAQWPIPEGFAPTADVVLLAIDHESRDDLHRLSRNQNGQSPT